jgi:hypothetical protein
MLYSVISDEGGLLFVSRIVEATDEIAAKAKLQSFYEGSDHFRQHKPRIVCATPAEIIGKVEVDPDALEEWFDFVDEVVYASSHCSNSETMTWYRGFTDFIERKLS